MGTDLANLTTIVAVAKRTGDNGRDVHRSKWLGRVIRKNFGGRSSGVNFHCAGVFVSHYLLLNRLKEYLCDDECDVAEKSARLVAGWAMGNNTLLNGHGSTGWRRMSCSVDGRKRVPWDLFVFKGGEARSEVSVILVTAKGNGQGDRLSSGGLEWSRRINTIINFRIGLITANAYISTLGGGHFLCKQIDAAEEKAQQQLRVACRLGDPVLATQCRIHLAYNQMQRGNLKRARHILRIQWAAAHVLDHGHLKAMVRSAWHHVKKLQSIQPELRKPSPSENKSYDPLYRQRFIVPKRTSSSDQKRIG